MHRIIVGVATIALAAGIAHAQPGKHEDKGGDKGRPVAERGPERGPERGSERHGPERREEAREDRRGEPREQRSERREEAREQRSERREEAREQRGARAEDAREDRREWRGDDRRVDRRESRRDDRRERVSDRFRDAERVAFARFGRDARSVVQGCPPGLAKRDNGCTPPGLARQQWVEYRPAYFGYPNIDDGRYYYDDGYLYRLGADNGIAGFIPLLGGALGIGEIWPSFYEPAPLPPYYVEYFNLGAEPGYRYADDVIYRVDPETSAITSIAALLTGDTFGVGQPMPAGYDVYNVPYGYRDQYYDTEDANYRYADGYIYEVDPTTQLISTVIELIA